MKLCLAFILGILLTGYVCGAVGDESINDGETKNVEVKPTVENQNIHRLEDLISVLRRLSIDSDQPDNIQQNPSRLIEDSPNEPIKKSSEQTDEESVQKTSEQIDEGSIVKSSEQDEGSVQKSSEQSNEGTIPKSSEQEEGSVQKSSEQDEGSVHKSSEQSNEGSIQKSSEQDEGSVQKSSEQSDEGLIQKSSEQDEGSVQKSSEQSDEGSIQKSSEQDEGSVQKSSEQSDERSIQKSSEESSEEYRIIENLQEQIITTEIYSSHRIVIYTTDFIENESCLLITPDGVQYHLIDGAYVPNVEIIRNQAVECGVEVNLRHYEMIGQYVLIARATRLSIPIERRQPFTLRVEDNFVLRDDITVREGVDVYLHLDYDIQWPETCMLLGPDGEDRTSQVEADTSNPANCGFIIRHVDETHNGQWIIKYGHKIERKGSVNIIVLASQPISIGNINLNVGDPVDMSVGPDNAVYCRIVDNNGHMVYDDFGQCRIVLYRVTVAHRGAWKMSVGLPGHVRLEEHTFYVEVLERGNKPVVTTAVSTDKPAVLLACSVPAQRDVRACKFRDPQNNILIASQGVGQGEYSFNNAIVNYETNANDHECTLRLTNPSARDLGIWRCAMDTSTGTYYGFLTVLCPFAMQDPDVAASVITEPVLAAESESLSYMENEPVVMSCFIPAPLRYCYFRARNGTVYNVFPGMSNSFGYVGSGLDAGECGIRFSSLSASETGDWTCHVGLVDPSAAEQRATIRVSVTAPIEVRLLSYYGASAVVEAVVNHPYAIDYCRFVRINGHGFTMENLPNGYTVFTSTPTVCSILIRNPNMIDLHPWTIAVKVIGQDGEISGTTGHLYEWTIKRNIAGEIIFWLLILFICLVPLLAACALYPKKNRQWTQRRATSIRNSFRNSWNNTFHKKPAPIQQKV